MATTAETRKAETKQLQTIMSEGRSKKLNFVALICKDGLVVEADKSKSVGALRKLAKAAGGGGQGGWGSLSVEGKTVVLECEDEPPGKLAALLKKHFADRGHSVTIEIHRKGARSETPAVSETLADVDMPAKSLALDATDTVPEAADPVDDTEDEDDAAAQAGDVPKLIAAARKKDFNFAWMLASDGMVLKAHRRKSGGALVKAAVQEGSTKRGATGTMRVDGKTVVLTCETMPPKSFARSARKFLLAQGQKCKVVVKSLDGAVVEEDDEDQTEAAVQGTPPAPEMETGATKTEPESTAPEKSPIEQLADRFDELGDWIDAAVTSDEKLATQVARLSDKVRDSIERGKEGMAIQFMDMLQAELNKVPRPEAKPGADATDRVAEAPAPAPADEPEDKVIRDDPVQPAKTPYQPPDPSDLDTDGSPDAVPAPEPATPEPATVGKSPLDQAVDEFAGLQSWIEAARNTDPKVAAQVARFTEMLEKNVEKGKLGMVSQALDMLKAELAKVPRPSEPAPAPPELSAADPSQDEPGSAPPSERVAPDPDLLTDLPEDAVFAIPASAEALSAADQQASGDDEAPVTHRASAPVKQVVGVLAPEKVQVDENADVPTAKDLLLRYADVVKDAPRYMTLAANAEMNTAVLQHIAGFAKAMRDGEMASAREAVDWLEAWAATMKVSLGPVIREERDKTNMENTRQACGLKPEQVSRLEDWLEKFSKAEHDGGKLLADAMAGKSALGTLSEAEQDYLVSRSARAWILSPYEGQHDGGKKIHDFAHGIADINDPDLSPRMAKLLVEVRNIVREEEDGIYAIEVRDLHSLLLEYVTQINPDEVAEFFQNPYALALWVTGKLRKPFEPNTSEDRRKNPNHKGFEPENAALMLAAVTENSSYQGEDRLTFISTLQANTRHGDLDDEGLRVQWGKTLASGLVEEHCLTEAAFDKVHETVATALKSDASRHLLFSGKVPPELRSWALSHMAPKPGDGQHDVWTAEDVKKGWESNAVSQSYARDPLKEARQSYGTPATFDIVGKEGKPDPEERARMVNLLGSALGMPIDNIPEDESFDEKEKRLEQEDKHPYFNEKNKAMANILKEVEQWGGNSPQFTPIPVAFTNNDFGATTFRVVRMECFMGEMRLAPSFFDHRGNVYNSASHWEEDNEIPDGRITYPIDLELGNKLKTVNTPERDEPIIWDILDIAAAAAGMVAVGFAVVGTGGAALAVVGTAAAVYSGGRSGARLIDKDAKGWDATDLSDPENRALWTDVVSAPLQVGAVAGTSRAAKLLSSNSKMSRMGAGVVTAMNLTDNVLDAVSQADAIYQLSKTWHSMPEGERMKALLGITGKFVAGGARLSRGGRVMDNFAVKRMYNELQHGSPYSLREAKTLKNKEKFADLKPGQVVVDYKIGRNGQPKGIRIVYGDGQYPTRADIELHSRAAAAMETSSSIAARLRKFCEGENFEPEPGSRAWEAQHELRKMGDEAEGLVTRLNSGEVDADEAAIIRTRIDELNAAIIVERRIIDAGIAEAGRGYVAAPSKGSEDATALGWPTKKGKDGGFDPKSEMPPGHHWRSAGDGKRPVLVRHDPNQPAYAIDPKTKSFVKAQSLGKDRADALRRANREATGGKPAPKGQPHGPSQRIDTDPILSRDKLTEDRFALANEVMPADSELTKVVAQGRKTLEKLKKMHEAGEISDDTYRGHVDEQIRMLDGVAENDPVFKFLMSQPDDVLKTNVDQFREAAKRHYETSRPLLEEFGQLQREARARGDLGENVYRAVLGQSLSRKGDWESGRMGDGDWRATDPEIAERMQDLNAHLASVDPKLKRERPDVVKFDDGDPDFAPFMFRAKTRMKGPKDAEGNAKEVEVTGDSRIVIGEASFYPPRFYEMAREVVSPARLKEIEAKKRKEVEGYDKLEAKTDPMSERIRILEALTLEQRVQIAGRLTKQEMDDMRDAHFAIADERLARRMGWMNGDTPDLERVKELREGRDSTKPKVAYPPDGELGYPPLTYNVQGREVVAGGFTWHHVEDSSELILVPRFLHGMIPHKGGISTRGKTN